MIGSARLEREMALPIRGGAFVAIVGPSGAGKDTLICYARDRLRGEACVDFVRRVVTRPALRKVARSPRYAGSSLVSGPAGQATVVAIARIEDVTKPNAPVLVDAHALVRVTMTDNGEPGRDDTVAITVLTHAGALWFSSRWDGVKTVDQTIAGGNIQVR